MEVPGVDLTGEDAQYFELLNDGRLKCRLNGHVLPAKADAITSFLRGSRFQRLKKQADDDSKLAGLEPFIVPSRNFPGKLYCALTCSVMNKNWSGVQRHIEGHRYRKAKEMFTKGDSQLMEEPDLTDSEGSHGGTSDIDEVMEDGHADACPHSHERLKELNQQTDQAQVLGIDPPGSHSSCAGRQRRKHRHLTSRPKRLKRAEA